MCMGNKPLSEGEDYCQTGLKSFGSIIISVWFIDIVVEINTSNILA